MNSELLSSSDTDKNDFICDSCNKNSSTNIF